MVETKGLLLNKLHAWYCLKECYRDGMNIIVKRLTCMYCMYWYGRSDVPFRAHLPYKVQFAEVGTREVLSN